MNDVENEAFINLFRGCVQQCFGQSVPVPLTEAQTRHLSNKILEETGLVIGAKSLKNYSIYIAHPANARQENPSVATLDTMARYVLRAPYTDETARKHKEGHYPYWFEYSNRRPVGGDPPTVKKKSVAGMVVGAAICLGVAVAVFLGGLSKKKKRMQVFSDNFQSLSDDSMAVKGWIRLSKDEQWWNRRNQKPGNLTLFTLTGDNWPDSFHMPSIPNLLLRKVNNDCFTAEIHFADFFPKVNWQQAGILLMEDTVFSSKALRFSLGYNDFFGGFERPKEVLLQCISTGGNDSARPEEIAHVPIFSIPANQVALVNNNLQYSALRIEKQQQHYRFLYSASPVSNFAFKEAFAKDLPIQPKYIGIFALQGFVSEPVNMAVYVTFFDISGIVCDQ